MTTTEQGAAVSEAEYSRPTYRTDSLPQARLVHREDTSEELMVIKLEPLDGHFNFKPGQYCTLGKEGVERAYSIVSAPYEPLLEIFVELVPEGELTPKMWRLNLGDTMSPAPPAQGYLRPQRKSPPPLDGGYRNRRRPLPEHHPGVPAPGRTGPLLLRPVRSQLPGRTDLRRRTAPTGGKTTRNASSTSARSAARRRNVTGVGRAKRAV